MIDKLSIFLPHVLMLIMALRLLRRDDLDRDPMVDALAEPFRRPRRKPAAADDQPD